jgi:NADPH-dependent glutamate synthase beta subunit-like oxidoreductase
MEIQTEKWDVRQGEIVKIKISSPSDIIVTNGESWKCPVYVKRMPPCRSNCPSSEDIRGYLTYIAQSKDYKRSYEDAFDEAWHILTDKNPFPAVHGRICPHPCEDGCNRQYKHVPEGFNQGGDGSVAINNFERFVGDYGIKKGLRLKKLTDKKRDKKAAIIGAGPSGLSCAYQLSRRGYPVTIFESAEKPGGMLRYGINRYRLPREILDAEIQNILNLGVELKCGAKVGRDISFEELKKQYYAIYIAVGAQKGSRMNVEGENLPAVFAGVDFLRKINIGEKISIGKKVMIIGGGNTAIDSSRVCRRLGAEVTILYRRTRNEMPALKHEITGAEDEGVKIEFLTAPVSISTNGDGSAIIKCIKMKLGEKDKSGRSRPILVEGSEFTIEADTVIAAIGQEPDLTNINGLKNKNGWLEVKSPPNPPFVKGGEGGFIEGVFAGGDVLALANATTAVGHGRRAARAIEAYLNGIAYKETGSPRTLKQPDMILDYYPAAQRNNVKSIPIERRLNSFDEVNLPLVMEEAIAEANRCMSCGLCFTCDRCRIYCPREAISRDRKRPVGQVMFTDYTKCIGCHICAEVCPCHYIEMGMGI